MIDGYEVIDWPVDLVPTSASGLRFDPHVGGSESPFTRTRKVYGLSKPRWRCSIGFTASRFDGAGAQRRGARLDAMVARLNGGLTLVRLWDWHRPYPLGLSDYYSQFAGDTWSFDGGETFGDGELFTIGSEAEPLNQAAAQGATSVIFEGFAGAGVTVFREGDYFGAIDRPRIVTADAVTDEDGAALVSFAPALEAALGAGGTIVTRPTGVFQLENVDAGASASSRRQRASWQFDFVEYLP